MTPIAFCIILHLFICDGSALRPHENGANGEYFNREDAPWTDQRIRRSVDFEERDDEENNVRDYQGLSLTGRDTPQRNNNAQKDQKEQKPGVKVWDNWSKWSECSVSCGIGKMVRWRHCISGNCAKEEKEAEIKICEAAICPEA